MGALGDPGIGMAAYPASQVSLDGFRQEIDRYINHKRIKLLSAGCVRLGIDTILALLHNQSKILSAPSSSSVRRIVTSALLYTAL